MKSLLWSILLVLLIYAGVLFIFENNSVVLLVSALIIPVISAIVLSLVSQKRNK